MTTAMSINIAMKPMSTTIRHCQFCHLAIVPPTNYYLLNKIVTCLSCRRIYYAIWKELNQLSILDYIEHKNSPDKISKIILKYLNSEEIKSFCLQFLDFSSTRNYARCPILVSSDPSINCINGSSRKLGTLNQTNRKTRKITAKYVKLCRFCRFRKMLLSVREIPKSKLILKVDKYSEQEIEILNLYAFDNGQRTPMTIFLGEELQEIFIHAHLIFDHLETLIREIESRGGYSDLTASPGQVLKSNDNFNQTVKPEPNTNNSDSFKITEESKVVAYNFQASKVHKFYELTQSVSRFHEVYTVNKALEDMCKLFQMCSDKIDTDLARMRTLELTNPNHKAIELLPLSNTNQERQVLNYTSNFLACSAQPTFTSITEIKSILSNEIRQLNISANTYKMDSPKNYDSGWVSAFQDIKKKNIEQSKSERIQEILQDLKSEPISLDNRLEPLVAVQKSSQQTKSERIQEIIKNLKSGFTSLDSKSQASKTQSDAIAPKSSPQMKAPHDGHKTKLVNSGVTRTFTNIITKYIRRYTSLV